MKLHKIYHPITATPYKYTSDYMEFEPRAPLKPYIRCFWGSRNIVLQNKTLRKHMELSYLTPVWILFLQQILQTIV